VAKKTTKKSVDKKPGVKVHTEQDTGTAAPIPGPVQFRIAVPFGIPDFNFGLANMMCGAPSASSAPRTDIIDNGDSFIVNVDLPGVEEKDVDLDVSAQSIKITARKSSESEANENGYCRKESTFSGYQRLAWLPQRIDPKSAKADMENGVLKVWAKKAN